MTKMVVLSLVALSFYHPPHCAAQDLVPVIYLSSAETAKAKEFAQTLKRARDRNNLAITAWRNFHQSYQAAHSEMPGLRFASDFRLAVAPKDPSNPSVDEASVVELSAKDRQNAESLYREMGEAKRAFDQAQKNWRDY